MSKFWQKKYISKYTGAEIDAAVAKAGDATQVVANPTLAGTEAALEGLQVGDTKYKVDSGSGGALVATVTVDEHTETVSVDKTFNELSAAFAAKTPLWLILPDDQKILPVRYTADAEHVRISWDFLMVTDLQGTPYAQITNNTLTIATNNVVAVEMYTVMCSGTTP